MKSNCYMHSPFTLILVNSFYRMNYKRFQFITSNHIAYYNMPLSPNYSTQTLSTLNEVQLQQTLKQFKSQHLPLWKYAAFIGYNFMSFSLMTLYGYSFKFKFTKPGQKKNINPKDLTLVNIIKKGTKHGVLISSLYIAGMYLLVSNIFPFEIFYKLSEIESTIHSFAIRYDTFYQETMLFAKMRKFGLSDELIGEIRQELEGKKTQLQKSNGLKPDTLKHLQNSKIWYETRKDAIDGMEDFV